MTKYRYIQASKVRQYCNEHERNVSADFLETLDAKVEAMIRKAVRIFNGHKKTLTGASLAVQDDIKELGKGKGIRRGKKVQVTWKKSL